MQIYFAGSIRGGREDVGIYTEIIKHLGNYGEVLTEHIGDRRIGQEGEHTDVGLIYDRDMKWLESSDIIVAEITKPSLGVGYELGHAEKSGKKILCLYRGDINVVSAMISGNPHFVVMLYKDTREAMMHIDTFMSQLQSEPSP